MSQKQTLLLIVVVAAMLSVGAFSTILNPSKVQAQERQTFTTTLSGEEEGPLNNSTANGTANFEVNSNGDVSYTISLKGLKLVDNLDLVVGSNASEGDKVVRVATGEEADNKTKPEITLTGNITQDDLTGAFKGKNMTDLVALLRNGSAYLEADTPIYPKGAIEGQIKSGSETSAASSGSETSAGMSNTTSASTMASTSEENDQTTPTAESNATVSSMTNSTNNEG